MEVNIANGLGHTVGHGSLVGPAVLHARVNESSEEKEQPSSHVRGDGQEIVGHEDWSSGFGARATGQIDFYLGKAEGFWCKLSDMREGKMYAVGLLALVVAGLLVYQVKALRGISARLGALEARVTAAADAPPQAPARRERENRLPAALDYSERLRDLESSVAQLSRATDYLMERGQLPLATNKLEDVQRRLMDASLPDRERLQALRLLRRNRTLTEETLQATIQWLQSAQDPNTRREMLQMLDGVTNAALRDPLLKLAAADPNSDVRQEAVENLGQFVTDPQVEARLWETMKSDPEGDVREEAEDALREGPMTPERLARLQQRAIDPNASLEERLTAYRAVVRAGGDSPQAIAALTQMAQTTTDPSVKARIFDAWDGSRDPSIKAPLLNGLQDPNPNVRRVAVDALDPFARDDPTVEQWLRYLAQTDPDAGVRREATQALANRR